MFPHAGFTSAADCCKLVTCAPPTLSEATQFVPVALSLPTRSLVSTSNEAEWTLSMNLRPDLVVSVALGSSTPVVGPLENEHLLCRCGKDQGTERSVTADASSLPCTHNDRAPHYHKYSPHKNVCTSLLLTDSIFASTDGSCSVNFRF